MEQIIEEYGNAIVEFIGTSLIIGILLLLAFPKIGEFISIIIASLVGN